MITEPLFACEECAHVAHDDRMASRHENHTGHAMYLVEDEDWNDTTETQDEARRGR